MSLSRKWRYFINLTGQEFPLKTNWDIVKILKVLRGANNIEGTINRLLSGILQFHISMFLFMLKNDSLLLDCDALLYICFMQ